MLKLDDAWSMALSSVLLNYVLGATACKHGSIIREKGRWLMVATSDNRSSRQAVEFDDVLL